MRAATRAAIGALWEQADEIETRICHHKATAGTFAWDAGFIHALESTRDHIIFKVSCLAFYEEGRDKAIAERVKVRRTRKDAVLP